MNFSPPPYDDGFDLGITDFTAIPPGSINGDTTIDFDDLNLGFQVLTGKQPSEEIRLMPDVDGENRITIQENIHILQHLTKIQ